MHRMWQVSAYSSPSSRFAQAELPRFLGKSRLRRERGQEALSLAITVLYVVLMIRRVLQRVCGFVVSLRDSPFLYTLCWGAWARAKEGRLIANGRSGLLSRSGPRAQRAN